MPETAIPVAIRLYSRHEVCGILGISTETLRRWVRDKDFPQPIMIGRAPKWKLSDIEEAINVRRASS